MIIIRGAQVLDIAAETLVEKDILIDGDKIKEIGPALPAPESSTSIDGSGRIAMPGLINAHTHAHNNLTKGLADNWTLEDLRSRGAALNSNRTPEDQYLSAAIGAIEMLKTGCTTAYDLFSAMPIHTPEGIAAVVQAYTDVGLRGVLAPMMSDTIFYRSIPGLMGALPPDLERAIRDMSVAPTQQVLGIAEAAIDQWNGSADGRLSIAIAPAVPGECTDEFLKGCGDLSRSHGVSVHTHLAETKVQAVAGQRRWGHSIVAHLVEQRMISDKFVGAHSVWIDATDLEVLADHDATVVHNPASNLKLGSGIAPIRELLDAGITVGLGSDGSMSSDNQNMFEAMRFAALVNKIRFGHLPERWIGAGEVMRMATEGGARVLGLTSDVGKLEPGRKADIVLLNADSVFLRPLNNPINALVYCETGADVDTVLVNGKIVVANGKVLTVDERRIRERAQIAIERLLRKNQPLLDFADRIEPFLRSACAICAASAFPVNRYAANAI